VHDFFNVMAVAVLLPLELMTGTISKTATWISDRLVGTAGSEWKSPVKAWVKKPVELIVEIEGAVGLSGNVLGTFVVLTGLIIVLLAHATFNVMGIGVLYVLPFARDVPVRLAEGLAEIAVKRRVWAVAYVMTAFIILPLFGVALLR
jgi:sodium-dependent phosphate cotransporter